MDKRISDKYVKLIKKIDKEDIEFAHIEADEIVCRLLYELGYRDVADAYNDVQKWYS